MSAENGGSPGSDCVQLQEVEVVLVALGFDALGELPDLKCDDGVRSITGTVIFGQNLGGLFVSPFET